MGGKGLPSTYVELATGIGERHSHLGGALALVVHLEHERLKLRLLRVEERRLLPHLARQPAAHARGACAQLCAVGCAIQN